MKKLILTAVTSLASINICAGAVLKAYDQPAANAFASAGFSQDLNFISAAAAGDIKADTAGVIKPVSIEPQKAGSYVSVSGYVSLTGSAYIPQNGGFTSVTMTGWATFRDSTGKVSSNNTYVNVMASMWIYPNQYVSQSVRPNIYVQFYREGKNVGSANMTGSINVGGWPSGNYVSLNGAGYLNGSFYAEDARLTDPARQQDDITVLKEIPLLDLLAERSATSKGIALGGASFMASVSLDDNWDIYFQLKQENSGVNPGVWKGTVLKNGVTFKYSGGELKIKEENGVITLTDAKGNSARTSLYGLFDLLYAGSSRITFDDLVTCAVIRNLAPLSGNEGIITLRIGSDGLYYYSLTTDKQAVGTPRWLLAITGVLYGLKITDTDAVFLSKPIEDAQKPLFQERQLKF